jgi:hypothetical protein
MLVTRGTLVSGDHSPGGMLSHRELSRQLEIGHRFHSRKINVDRSTHRLAIAILVQAFRDVFSSRDMGKGQVVDEWRRDALKWFASNEENPGSLQWVSRIIELDVETIRSWVIDNSSCGMDAMERCLSNLRRRRSRW